MTRSEMRSVVAKYAEAYGITTKRVMDKSNARDREGATARAMAIRELWETCGHGDKQTIADFFDMYPGSCYNAIKRLDNPTYEEIRMVKSIEPPYSFEFEETSNVY